MLRAVLLDVGGTLWTNNLVLAPGAAEAIWLQQVAEALPEADSTVVREVLAGLMDLEVGTRLQSAQGIEADVARVLARVGLPTDEPRLTAVRRAMVVPARVGIRRHPGFERLFAAIAPLPVHRAIVSNTNWRDGEGYWRDFRDFGVAQQLHAITTSVDVGQKKPHRAMFDAALSAAGCDAAQAVMVGNSEVADVIPAKSLGMRTIRVCIEESLTTESAADAVVGSLDEVASLIRRWTHE